MLVETMARQLSDDCVASMDRDVSLRDRIGGRKLDFIQRPCGNHVLQPTGHVSPRGCSELGFVFA